MRKSFYHIKDVFKKAEKVDEKTSNEINKKIDLMEKRLKEKDLN